MQREEYKAILVGLLFVWADPLPFREIAEILNLSTGEVEILCQELSKQWQTEEGGLMLRFYDDGVQLVTNPKYHDFLARLYAGKKANPLTHSSLETLAVIAYQEPVTRLEVDEIRGVSAASSIDTLLRKGLIEECGRLDQPGRPILYRTTGKFLQQFNLPSRAALPNFDQWKDALEKEDEGAD